VYRCVARRALDDHPQGIAAKRPQVDSCFQRGLSWPEKYVARGAIRVRDYDEIQSALDHEAPAPKD
jgi:hypothetical protein